MGAYFETKRRLFDMLPAEAVLPEGRTAADSATVRTVFIIDPVKKVRLMLSYPMSVGRSFVEVLRARRDPGHRPGADRHPRELAGGRGCRGEPSALY